MRPVHHLAQCMDCHWTWTTRNAVAMAVRHSKATGHEVAAEVMLSGRWVAGKRAWGLGK